MQTVKLPSLEDLRCFVLAADHGKFYAAARHPILNTSPQLVSNAIRRLERRLGVELFDRRGGCLGVEPSESAILLLPQARSIVEDASELVASVGER